MKISKILLTFVFVFSFLLGQIPSTNVSAATENKEDCGCNSPLLSENKSIKNVSKVDKKLIKRAEKHVKKDYFMKENQDKDKNDYKKLNWEESYIIEYTDESKVIIVPFNSKKVSEEQVISSSLIVPYNSEKDAFGAGVISDVIVDKDNEDQLTVKYYFPNGSHLLTMIADFKTNELQITESYSDDYYVNLANEYALKSGNAGGYWKCVGKCLKGAWNTFPGPLRALCEGSCVACFIEPTKASCVVCIGCLAGSALGCIIKCS